MAEIVFGVGSSHTPMLGTQPEDWDQRAEADRNNPAHPFRGGVYTYEELTELRKGENLAAQHTAEVRQERHDASQAVLDQLGDKIRAANLDVLVIFGDDQRECFLLEQSPAFSVYNGEKVLNKTMNQERLDAMPPGIAIAAWTNVPEDHDLEYAGEPELADHVVSSLMVDEFDVSVSSKMPDGKWGENGIGHAFGFFYHRILNDFESCKDMATLPIFINTFFPPNQPTAKRVLNFGKAVGNAIRAWDSDKRVGIAASGGFSHFIIDEELDMRILKAIADGDEAAIINEPEYSYQSGSSEIKNWIAAMGATQGSGLKFDLLDYVPCYRSDAGTGNANTFGVWS